MNLFSSLTRSQRQLTLDEWASFFSFNGSTYPLTLQQTLGGGEGEKAPGNFAGYGEIFKGNATVFAVMAVRSLLFSEARLQFRQMSKGRPGDLFGTPALSIVEKPWPNGTTGDLLARAIQDVDLAGNFYATRHPPAVRGGDPRLERLRPDWVTIILGSESEVVADQPSRMLDADILGYAYQPGGPASGNDPVVLLPNQVAHFAPIPDPTARFRGASWLSAVTQEVMGDRSAATHKRKFFDNGATPNLVVTLGDANLNPRTFQEWVEKMELTHAGVENAYRTLYLAAGADAKVVGSDMRQIDFKSIIGSGETRIAAAAGVPPIIVGFSEGLSSATYSNYSQARRRFADGTLRPLWRNFCGSMSTLVEMPPGAMLWYDDRHVPFLAEDVKDAADVQQANAITIRELINAGFTPESVVAAVNAEDFSKLVHTGLVSVQLQQPGVAPVSANGSGSPVPAP